MNLPVWDAASTAQENTASSPILGENKIKNTAYFVKKVILFPAFSLWKLYVFQPKDEKHT